VAAADAEVTTIVRDAIESAIPDKTAKALKQFGFRFCRMLSNHREP
jgi:hypothetical protein